MEAPRWLSYAVSRFDFPIRQVANVTYSGLTIQTISDSLLKQCPHRPTMLPRGQFFWETIVFPRGIARLASSARSVRHASRRSTTAPYPLNALSFGPHLLNAQAAMATSAFRVQPPQRNAGPKCRSCAHLRRRRSGPERRLLRCRRRRPHMSSASQFMVLPRLPIRRRGDSSGPSSSTASSTSSDRAGSQVPDRKSVV